MPLRLLLDNFEGAIFCRASAKPCKASDEGENWTVECAKAVEDLTATTVHVELSTAVAGLHGDIATCSMSGTAEPFVSSWAEIRWQ